MKETPLQNKIVQQIHRLDTEEIGVFEIMQELASWVVQTVMPSEEEVNEDPEDCTASCREETIKKALSAGITLD